MIVPGFKPDCYNVHNKLKKRVIFIICFLLQFYMINGIGTRHLAAENFSLPADPAPEVLTYAGLEKIVLGRMVIRADWAKFPADNGSTKGFYHAERKTVKFIGIHHDGSTNATLKSVLKYHIKTNGWGDIAYHFIIDKKGRIYEGRSLERASDTNNVFKSYGEERLSRIVNILLLGNYNTEKIKSDSPQMQSAKFLVSYLYLKYPLVTLDSIRGHRDFIEDSEKKKYLITCPGKNMYTPVNMIDEIKNFVSSAADSNKPKID